jgi:hypothetical protein
LCCGIFYNAQSNQALNCSNPAIIMKDISC